MNKEQTLRILNALANGIHPATGEKFGADSPLYEHHTMSLVFNDPSYHTRVRRLLAPFFAMQTLRKMEDRVATMVDELLDDVAVRVAPLTDHDVDEMLESLRSYPLLTGYRGAAVLDIAALRDVLHRISTLAAEVTEIAEIDLNPIFLL